MLYTIENENIRASFSSCGGEMTSIYGKATDCEYLWQGDEASWAGQAPVLFPICGRLLEGYYTYEGKRYAALQPLDEVAGIEDDEIVLLEIVKENGEESYRTIDNEILLDEVFNEFQELFDEEDEEEE